MSALSINDQKHLSEVTKAIDWNRIATAMRALNWYWYTIPDRTPNAGEIRDEALARLADCIREARSTNKSAVCMQTGGFEYAVLLDTGNEERDPTPPAEVVYLSCSFVLESTESQRTNPDGSHSTRSSHF
jgi:hypothetical protein